MPPVLPPGYAPALQSLWAQCQELVLLDGILYIKWEGASGGGGKDSHLQLVLLKMVVPDVVQQLQDSPTVGHLGITKVLQKIKWRFSTGLGNCEMWKMGVERVRSVELVSCPQKLASPNADRKSGKSTQANRHGYPGPTPRNTSWQQVPV